MYDLIKRVMMKSLHKFTVNFYKIQFIIENVPHILSYYVYKNILTDMNAF